MKTITGAKFKEARVKAGTKKSLQQANGTVLLNQCFRTVPSYPNLKIFKEYSEIKQWDGSEYWAACRQLVPVVTPLLIKDDPGVLQCIQAIIDYVHMVQYKSHTDKTLCYMGHAFYRINQTKKVFKDACQTDAMIRGGKNGHFNFPKWHIMSHYPE